MWQVSAKQLYSASHSDLTLNVKFHKSYRWKLQTFSLSWYLHFISKQGKSEKENMKLVSESGAIPLFIQEKQ